MFSENTVPRIVFFSSVTENTKRFVDRLGVDSFRIPIKTKEAEECRVNYPYILITPSYGGGSIKGAVPKQVIRFLNNESNRLKCVGVISSGNTNFGEAYSIAGSVISRKLGVPKLFSFELAGTDDDVSKVREGIFKHWRFLVKERAEQV